MPSKTNFPLPRLAAKENSAPETTPAVATEETPATTEAPVVAEEKPEKKEKVKTPLFEK
jgi:hypothetical protein